MTGLPIWFFYYKDHTGETIRRAIYMAKEWIDTKGAQIEGLHIDLAGGPVGVTAAINEEAFDTNVIVVAGGVAPLSWALPCGFTVRFTPVS